MWQIIKKFKRLNVLLLLGLLIQPLAQTLASVTISQSINALAGHHVATYLFYVVLNLTVWVVLLYCGYYFVPKFEEKVVQIQSNYIRNQVMNRLSQTDFHQFHQKSSDVYVSYFTNDINRIQQEGMSALYSTINATALAIFSGLALIYFDWRLLVYAIVFGAFLTWLPRLFAKKMQTVTQKQSAANETYTGRLADILAGFDTFKQFDRSSLMVDKMQSTQDKVMTQNIAYTKQRGAMQANISMVNILTQVGMSLLSAILFFNHDIKIGALFSVGTLSGLLFSSATTAAASYAQIAGTQAIFQKYQTIIVAPDQEHSIKTIKKITLQDVVVRFKNDETIHFPTLTFLANQKYMIVGPSGSGKSTLLKVIAGQLVPKRGHVLYNDQPEEVIDNQSLRQNIALVTQTPYLFSGTLRENITLDRNIPEEQLSQVIKQSGLSEFVSEKGLNYQIKSGAENVSGGQKQRIALARGLALNCQVILLDEVSSAIDQQAAVAIEHEILSMSNKTVLMITHQQHPAVLPLIDKVVSIS